ncbi:MAG: enoyl-CoA hydratase/isomerase family protein [Hyphomicrobiaceae bacterium]
MPHFQQKIPKANRVQDIQTPTSILKAPAAADDITVSANRASGLVTLTRARALNAMTNAMRLDLAAAMPLYMADHEIYAVIIQSESEKAFCAGVDVRELVRLGKDDRDEARQSFAREYNLNWQLECFAKPTVSLIDGIVMGSGVGISIYGTHRVAGAGYKFAMPETAIGLFPDVGTAFILSRLPKEIGIYLGLTGRTIDRSDALALGLATHAIGAENFDDIREGLADTQPIDPLLGGMVEDIPPSDLMAKADVIASCFGADNVLDIKARLGKVGADNGKWAKAVIHDLDTKSPLSLAITLRHLRRAKAWDLRQTLIMDYRLAWRFLNASDFYEGVRALLIEKDNAPKWQPKSLEMVDEALVDSYFASLGAEELPLQTRDEMQLVRR